MELTTYAGSCSAIRSKAGCDAIRFHDLRHAWVTLLLDLGRPPHDVRKFVDHSVMEVTMTIYARVLLADKRKALGKLGEALG